MARKLHHVKLTNRWAYLLDEDYDYDRLIPYWSFSVPNFHFMQNKYIGWDGRIKFLKYGKVPAGLFRATRKEIEDAGRIKFNVRTKLQDLESVQGDRSNRAYQNDCVYSMLSAIRRGGGLVLNATGTGKTRIAGLFSAAIVGTVCFVVDQLDLLEQAVKELKGVLGEEIGYVGNSVFSPKRITVATVQTVHRHIRDPKFRRWFENVNVVIIDEIHVQMARRNFKSVERMKPLAVFGLTATLQLKKKPVRTKAYAIAGPVIYEYPVAKGMDEGVLSRGVVVRVQFRNVLDLEQTYREQYMDNIVDSAERNSVVSRLTRWAIKKKGKYVIVLVSRIQHLKNLSKRLWDIPHKVVFGEKEVKERQSSVRKFEKGEIRLLIANQVFKKGVNIKRVDMMIDATASKNPDDALQKFGRGLRLHDDKEGFMYFDIADEGGYDNRYEVAAKRRKKAFKKAGVRTIDVRWRDDAKEVYRTGVQFLEKEIKRNEYIRKDS
jgi:superfamily II DNA or RNA helicase